jgi:hypothetical protein
MKINQIYLQEKQSVSDSVWNFTICAVLGIGCYLNYVAQDHWTALLAGVFSILHGYAFLSGKSFYAVKFPKPSDGNYRLYKVGDVYFVGCSKQEAELFAFVRGLENAEITEITDGRVYHFS